MFGFVKSIEKEYENILDDFSWVSIRLKNYIDKHTASVYNKKADLLLLQADIKTHEAAITRAANVKANFDKLLGM